MHAKFYDNAYECNFGAEDIRFPGCFIGKRGLGADLAKVKAIVDSPVPKNRRASAVWYRQLLTQL